MSSAGSLPNAEIMENPVLRSGRRKRNGRANGPAAPGSIGSSHRLSGFEAERDRLSHNVIPTDFVELEDGTLAELIQHPDDPQRTLFALWKKGMVTYEEKLEIRNRILVPTPRYSNILRQIRLPQKPKPYESIVALALSIMRFIERHVALRKEDLVVLMYFVLSTWVSDRLPVAVYVALVGLLQSGKTTLLRTLSLICRRSLLISDAPIAAIYELYAQLPPTLLIDEAALFTEVAALRRLLRTGTTRDVSVLRGTHALHAFGPKVVCWTDPPDDFALNSRCIQISMVESREPVADLSDRTTAELAEELQGQLLQFRLENYTRIRVTDIPNIEMLRPRSRDILKALVAPFGDNLGACEPLIDMLKKRAFLQKEPLPPEHTAVVATLFSHIHQESFQALTHLSNLTDEVNGLLAKRGERLRLNPRKVGSILRTLGFLHRQRRNDGWTVVLYEADQELIHDLVENHGIDSIGLSSIKADISKCAMCHGMHHKKPKVTNEV